MSYAVDHASSRQIDRHYTQLKFRIKRLVHKQENDCFDKAAPAQKTVKKRWYGSVKGRIKTKMKSCFIFERFYDRWSHSSSAGLAAGRVASGD
ncbi:hypothetical protein BL127_00020310 [Raoultella planticola]|nr:hypothetical protein BL127_00020310 [Raoultella planticola]